MNLKLYFKFRPKWRVNPENARRGQLASLIYVARKDAKLTRAEVAARSRTSINAVKGIETNKFYSAKTVAAIAAVLPVGQLDADWRRLLPAPRRATPFVPRVRAKNKTINNPA
ncbi:MAG: helix-turn-helix transcriptional regulator [Verrucomicrobiales bacterium]|jgi:transcriptional regulator with XRE-family HTH domain|nr:helix-turn-helix transcriptional regulator [Verrucomicrobiales bacterium]